MTDPDRRRNFARAILETIDTDLKRTGQLLDQGSSGSNSEGHEDAIAALLWMLGFSTIRSGSLSKDAADIYAIAASGDILVVECTLGDMKSKRGSKIQNLLDRCKAVRDALTRSGEGHLNCIPVVASGRTREDIEDDIETCERQGIAVFTKDDLDEVMNLSHQRPNSVARIKEIRTRVGDAARRIRERERAIDDTVEGFDKMKRSLDAASRDFDNNF